MSRPGPVLEPTPDPARSIAEIEAAFRENYVRYQYCLVDFMAEHLADASRAFKGDMQLAVLLAIIGQVTLQAVTAARASGRTIDDIPPERRGISTFRLADATSIPRETVRRKLVALERMGWLKREENFWFLTFAGADATARHDLAEVDSRSIGRAARFYAGVAPLVSAVDQGSGGLLRKGQDR